MRYIGKHKAMVVDLFYYSAVIQGDVEGFDERARHILDLPVLSVARRKVITVSWDEDIEQVAALLGNKQIKKVPVERSGVLVGIISRGDVIRQVFKTLL
jgi:CBS domain-containing protein